MTQDNELTRPSYYQPGSPFEPIKIIEHYGLDFCLGNVIKYTLRAGNKASETIESDLAKAAWYAARAAEGTELKSSKDHIVRLRDLYDEESYMVGMSDASGSPSLVLRAIIYALQESGLALDEQFIAESDLNVAPTKAVEIERVKYYGEPGFMVRVVDLNPISQPEPRFEHDSPAYYDEDDYYLT